MKTIVASFLIFLVTGAIPTFAQNADAKLRSELIRLHTEWFGAFDRGDGAAMDRMEVPNVALVFQDGTLWKKAEPRVGKQKPTQFTSRTLTDVELRQFGNAVILTGSLISKSADSGLDEAGTTVVFVRQGPEWRIASAQWSVTKRPEDDINRAGYELMNSGRVTEAIWT